MKKHAFLYLMTGILIGALLFGALPAIGAGVTAILSSQQVTVNGKAAKVTVYSIEGSNYFKLRDFAAIVDVGVWFDAPNNTVRIETDKKYDPAYTGPSPAPAQAPAQTAPTEPKAESAIKILDYYDSSGKFSSLGQALPSDTKTGDKVLTVRKGDTVVVGDKQYKVTADTIDLSFYTQPSTDKVIIWWTDYMKDWLEGGKVTEIK